MPSCSRLSLPLYLLACLLALLGLGGLWYGLGKPVHLPDAASPAHKLQCASYTPFDKDQSPYDQPFRLRPARMDADLALLAERFQCIRTYSMSGLEAIPALARKHGLKVMLGAWVNAHPADTEREINLLIAAANANPDVVSAVIVGNETLLRKEVTGAQLVRLITKVKSQVKQPVTYADVWEFWLKHPEIAPAVDFLTIHLLPYWEDDPSNIDAALQHVAQVRQVFGNKFAPKDVMIGETGWPSEGRQRETALPSRVNEAKFIRGFVAMAEANGWHYNLIEAFDQPWKRISEGAVGGYWGLYDADRQDKSILAGPVSNLPQWSAWLAFSLIIAAATLLLAGRPASARAALLLPLLVDEDNGGVRIAQSLAIIEYLDEMYPQPALLPAEPATKAKVRALALDIACDIHPLNNLRVLQYLTGPLTLTEQQKQDWILHWLHTGFSALEQRLKASAGQFCFGDEPTLADICLVPQVYNAQRFALDMTAYPTINAVHQHCQQLAAFALAAPEQQPDKQ